MSFVGEKLKEYIIKKIDEPDILIRNKFIDLCNYIIKNNIKICLSDDFYILLLEFFKKAEFYNYSTKKLDACALDRFQKWLNGSTIENSVVETFPKYFKFYGDEEYHGNYLTNGIGNSGADLEVVEDFEIDILYENEYYKHTIKKGEHVDIKSHLYYEDEYGNILGGDSKKPFKQLAHEYKDNLCHNILEYVVKDDSWYLLKEQNGGSFLYKLPNFKTNLKSDDLFKFYIDIFKNELKISHLLD